MAAKKASKKSAKKATKGAVKLAPLDNAVIKRVTQIEDTAAAIVAKQAVIAKEETKLGKLKSDVSDQKDFLSQLRAEERDLQNDLLHISSGGFSDRLDFAQAKTTSPAMTVVKSENVTTAKADPDAWKKLTLHAMGLTNKRAISALEAAGITTFGQAADRLGDQFAKPIPNFGEAARQAYDDAQEAYWKANPLPKVEAKPKTAPGDKPGEASRGAAVDREKEQLAKDVDTQLNYFTLPQTKANAMKVLAKVMGRDPKEAFEAATLDQLAEWKLKVKNISEGDIKAAVASMA